MIGIGFLIRLVQFSVAVIVIGLIIVALAYVVSYTIQISHDITSDRLGGFAGWLRTKLPKRSKKENKTEN